MPPLDHCCRWDPAKHCHGASVLSLMYRQVRSSVAVPLPGSVMVCGAPQAVRWEAGASVCTSKLPPER
jgi:hypothetical protein